MADPRRRAGQLHRRGAADPGDRPAGGGRDRAAVLLVGAGQAGPAQLRPQPAPHRDHRGRADGRHRADHRASTRSWRRRTRACTASPTTQVKADLFISGDQMSERPPTFDPAVVDKVGGHSGRQRRCRPSTGTRRRSTATTGASSRSPTSPAMADMVGMKAGRRQPRPSSAPDQAVIDEENAKRAGPDGRLDGAGAVRPRRPAHADDRGHLRQERGLRRLRPVAVGDPGPAASRSRRWPT